MAPKPDRATRSANYTQQTFSCANLQLIELPKPTDMQWNWGFWAPGAFQHMSTK